MDNPEKPIKPGYDISFSPEGALIVRRGKLEIVIGDAVDESVLIRDRGEGVEDKSRSASLRIVSKHSQFNGGISRTACFPPKVFQDTVEWEIRGFDPVSRALCTNQIYLGGGGHFYQWGDCDAKLINLDTEE